MKYRHREYTVPAAPPMAPAPKEVERVEAILRRLVESCECLAGLDVEATIKEAIESSAREIVSGAYVPQAREPKVHVFEVSKLEAMGLQPFESPAPLTIKTHYDPDTYGDDGEGGISGDGMGDIRNP